MKKIILLLLIYSSSFYSQEKISKIDYCLVVGDDKELDNGPLGEYYKEAKKNAKYVFYSLDFNDIAMLFYEKKGMNSENGNNAFSKAFSGVEGKYYKEKNSNDILKEIDNKSVGHFLVKTTDNSKWILTKESKKIMDYLCYKATAIVTVKNEAGNFKRTITAWYCPKIPIQFGPKGYGGLPGLIMELQDRNIIIGAIKIDLKSKTGKIEKPQKGKRVNEQEYDKIIEDFSRKMNNENK
jgi:GLPGLI family protein